MPKFWKNRIRLGFGSKSQQSSSSNTVKGKSENISFETGERIVWNGENGPEHGTVKWLGIFPDKGKKLFAGVELDKPSESSGISFHNEDLFQAKINHSALVPADKLIKEKEFQAGFPTGNPSGIVTTKQKKKWFQELLHPSSNKQHKNLNQQNKKEHLFYQTKDQFATEEKEECTAKQDSEQQPEQAPPDYVYEPLNVTNTKAATTTTLRTSVAPSFYKAPVQLENNENTFIRSESDSHLGQESFGQSTTLPNSESPFSNSDENKSGSQIQPLVRKNSIQATNNQSPSFSAVTKQGIVQHDGHVSSQKSSSERSKFFESFGSSNLTESVTNRAAKYQQLPESVPIVSQQEFCGNKLSGITSCMQELSIKDSNQHASLNKIGTNKMRHQSPSAVRRRSSSAQESSAISYSKLHHSSDRVVKSEPRITTSSSESLSKSPYFSAAEKSEFGNNYYKARYKPNENFDYLDSKLLKREAVSENFGTSQEKNDSYMKKIKMGSPLKKEFLGNEFYGNSPNEFKLGDDLQNSYEFSEHLRTPTETDYVTPSPEAGNGFNFSETPKLGSALSSCSSESPEPETVDFEVGSVVEVIINDEPHYGVIRWIGQIDGKTKLVAGIEMEEESDYCSNGSFGNIQYFTCPERKGFFTFLSRCHKDGRFLESLNVNREGPCIAKFGGIDCPIVSGDIPPLLYSEHLLSMFGKNRGIQGHHNSCYLDATLFSMFSFTSVFDSLLLRPPIEEDIFEYKEVQQVLKEEIVNPLRQNFYVRADRVMKLRTLLEKLSSVTGLTNEEKDPEEFLNSLLHQILKAEPFLKLSSGQETYFYQLFVEKNENIKVPTVQQLFDQSFLTSDIKLKEIPSCLIIQMPRFGKQFKMYPKIFPSQVLDITDVLEDSPRQCDVCGELAEYECRDCFHQHVPHEEVMKTFCRKCNGRVHSHQLRGGHGPRKISVPENFNISSNIPRVYMDLFAVVCIETSHYVAFVKCSNGPDAPWCFFDSMADRKGERYGYNIPEVVSCPELLTWLSSQGHEDIEDEYYEKQMPELAKRLFSDAYMCMYQSSDIMMYR